MAYKPMIIKKTVTTAGTAERLTDLDILTPSVIIQAADDNTNGAFVGDSQVDKTLFNGVELNARESVTFNAVDPKSGKGLISLRDIWIDVDTSLDEVIACYLAEV